MRNVVESGSEALGEAAVDLALRDQSRDSFVASS